jgi:hypothetical protein
MAEKRGDLAVASIWAVALFESVNFDGFISAVVLLRARGPPRLWCRVDDDLER